MNSTQTTIKRARDVLGKPMSMAFISLIGKSIVVGIITGLIVGVFRWIIDQTMKLLMMVYPIMAAHPRYLLPYLIGTLVIGLLLSRVLKPYLLPQFRLTSPPSSFSVSGPVSTYQCT